MVWEGSTKEQRGTVSPKVFSLFVLLIRASSLQLWQGWRHWCLIFIVQRLLINTEPVDKGSCHKATNPEAMAKRQYGKHTCTHVIAPPTITAWALLCGKVVSAYTQTQMWGHGLPRVTAVKRRKADWSAKIPLETRVIFMESTTQIRDCEFCIIHLW